jgi:hypothetical protein
VRSLTNSISTIYASESGLTSFEGFPRTAGHLDLMGVNFVSLEGFPEVVHKLLITPFKGCLMFIHHKFHEEKSIDECYFYLAKGNMPMMKQLSEAFEKLSDPFEFQDWCISNGLEEFL